jgi:hypothetical protein
VIRRNSTYLFARPSLLEGMGRVLDLGGTLNTYSKSRSATAADSRAMRSDWQAIGDDLRVVMGQIKPARE